MTHDATPRRRPTSKRSLSAERRDELAKLAVDVNEPVAAEDGASPTDEDALRHAAIDAAAAQVMESLARQDARTPHDAAVAALGVDATDAQITEWINRYRPDAQEVTPPQR